MVEGIGRISSPLGVIRLGQNTRLIVSPWAAIGTDSLLIATGLTTWATARPTLLKVVGAVGTAWGVVALTAEIVKLIGGPEARVKSGDVEIQRQ